MDPGPLSPSSHNNPSDRSSHELSVPASSPNYSTPVKQRLHMSPDSKAATAVKTSASSSLQVSEEKARAELKQRLNESLDSKLECSGDKAQDMIRTQLDFISSQHSRPLSMKRPKQKQYWTKEEVRPSP